MLEITLRQISNQLLTVFMPFIDFRIEDMLGRTRHVFDHVTIIMISISIRWMVICHFACWIA